MAAHSPVRRKKRQEKKKREIKLGGILIILYCVYISSKLLHFFVCCIWKKRCKRVQFKEIRTKKKELRKIANDSESLLKETSRKSIIWWSGFYCYFIYFTYICFIHSSHCCFLYILIVFNLSARKSLIAPTLCNAPFARRLFYFFLVSLFYTYTFTQKHHAYNFFSWLMRVFCLVKIGIFPPKKSGWDLCTENNIEHSCSDNLI